MFRVGLGTKTGAYFSAFWVRIRETNLLRRLFSICRVVQNWTAFDALDNFRYCLNSENKIKLSQSFYTADTLFFFKTVQLGCNNKIVGRTPPAQKHYQA